MERIWYNGAEVIQRVLGPSKCSKYMFKILNFSRECDRVGSGTNQEGSYTLLEVGEHSKQWHLDQTMVTSTNSWLKSLRAGFADT